MSEANPYEHLSTMMQILLATRSQLVPAVSVEYETVRESQAAMEGFQKGKRAERERIMGELVIRRQQMIGADLEPTHLGLMNLGRIEVWNEAIAIARGTE